MQVTVSFDIRFIQKQLLSMSMGMLKKCTAWVEIFFAMLWSK